MFRYEGLRATLYQLQSKLLAMTGEDPLKDKGVSIIAPQFAPQKEVTKVSDRMSMLMIKSCVLVPCLACCYFEGACKGNTWRLLSKTAINKIATCREGKGERERCIYSLDWTTGLTFDPKNGTN